MATNKDKAATLADLETALTEPIEAESEETELSVEQAEPIATFDELLAKVEAQEDVVYRVIGGKRFGFKRIHDAGEWVDLIRKSQRGKEFTDNAAKGIPINPEETDAEKRLYVKDGDIVAQAHILLGTLAQPKPAKFADVLMLALKGGALFTSLVNMALRINGEEAIDAAKNGSGRTGSTSSKR